jgi:hypothetical protein
MYENLLGPKKIVTTSEKCHFSDRKVSFLFFTKTASNIKSNEEQYHSVHK